MILQETKVSVPWRKIFSSIPVWSVVMTNFFFYAAMKGIKVNLPLYIRETLDFTIEEVKSLSFFSFSSSGDTHLV